MIEKEKTHQETKSKQGQRPMHLTDSFGQAHKDQFNWWSTITEAEGSGSTHSGRCL